MLAATADARVVCFGEVLLRLTAPGRGLLMQQSLLSANFGGAEANVAVSLATLGRAAKVVTAVADNALGSAALGELRRHGVDVAHCIALPGRMGLYFVAPGAGGRATTVTYDRAQSAFAQAGADLFDWRDILRPTDWPHVSGVTLALGEAPAAAVARAVNAARAKGCRVSVDCNFRPSLWAARQTDPAPILDALYAEADILFAEPRDVELITGAAVAAESEHARTEAAAAAAFTRYPKLTHLAGTTRTSASADQCDLAAYLFTRDGAWRAPARLVSAIVDRIGSGDAFAAALLHGLMRGDPQQNALDFALAAAAIKHTLPGDFNLATRDVINAYANGRIDVRR